MRYVRAALLGALMHQSDMRSEAYVRMGWWLDFEEWALVSDKLEREQWEVWCE